ncbi:MAG: peptide deformylase [Candidatus Marinimicrobia bacterium]|nr:peptide deformylase [Candidatus Neomarinimicrobiota bacterium]
MAKLPVIKYGDPILRQKTRPVEDRQQVLDLVDDMFDTMYEEEGMGLAANQINVDLNFMVVDISHTDEDEGPRVIINAEVVESSGSSDLEEGCLSIPEIRATITRPETVLLRYEDEHGQEHEEHFDRLLSRVIQHEVDHLTGIFFTDYLTPAKHSLIDKRLSEIAETGAPSTGIIL